MVDKASRAVVAFAAACLALGIGKGCSDEYSNKSKQPLETRVSAPANPNPEIPKSLDSFSSKTFAIGAPEDNGGCKYQMTIFYIDGKPSYVRTRYFHIGNYTYNDMMGNLNKEDKYGNPIYHKAKLVLEKVDTWDGRPKSNYYNPSILNNKELDKDIRKSPEFN